MSIECQLQAPLPECVMIEVAMVVPFAGELKRRKQRLVPLFAKSRGKPFREILAFPRVVIRCDWCLFAAFRAWGRVGICSRRHDLDLCRSRWKYRVPSALDQSGKDRDNKRQNSH